MARRAERPRQLRREPRQGDLLVFATREPVRAQAQRQLGELVAGDQDTPV